jgi:glycosyltransferase involved in cell wall biosynthesis
LEAEKNVSSLVAAMRYVIDTHPNAVCVVAGEGNEMSLIQNRIAELGLNNSVRLVGFRDDAISLIAAADIFVLPSLNEPFGLVLLEAMALGKPVVATASGGPLEIVIDGVTGLLVPPATPLQLAEAINRLLCDRELREQMGAAGLRRFQECFTADRMAAETAAVYRQVCDAGRETSSEPIVRPEAAGVSVG